MDDSNTPDVDQTESRTPLGMNSFDQNEREQFGQKVRLAMGCIDGASEPVKGRAIPSDETSIRKRLKTLSQEITSNHADLLELLVRFDDLQGWKSSGASHCGAWMNSELGIGVRKGWEYLRVGRILRTMPTLKALFRVGNLTWSKVRLITRVVNEDNEKTLCHAALDASVSEVERLCREYRWKDKDDDEGAAENKQAIEQWESRSMSWNETSNGSTQIHLILPPEIAQAYLNSIEHSLNQLDDKGSKLSQRRADAAVLMAETSLQSAGRQIATADRYQVIVSVDASELSTADSQNTSNSNYSDSDIDIDVGSTNNNTPSKRPTVKGAGPIARETLRRIACDCSITVNQTANGEPVDIGRKSRIWPTAMERAIKERDQHCVWPGCTHSNHLHIHHIKHWANGGKTSMQNGACLCSHHHTLVHEGGYSIQRVENNDQRLHEQFVQQQHSDDISLFDFEQELRNDKGSFNNVRKLSPTAYRFRVVNVQGQDIRDISTTGINDGFRNDKTESPFNSPDATNDYTRVYCAEPATVYFYRGNYGEIHCADKVRHGKTEDRSAPLYSYEAPPPYRVHTSVPNTVYH